MVGDEGTGTKRIVNFQFLNILNKIHIFNSFLNIKGKKPPNFSRGVTLQECFLKVPSSPKVSYS